MKKTMLVLALSAAVLGAAAQSVTISIVASSDGSTYTTNTISVPAVRVRGLVEAWGEDCKNKTNAVPPVAALTLGQFMLQEVRDKGVEYQKRGVTAELLDLGVTNPPAKLVDVWTSLTPEQRTNAVNYAKQVGQ
jgi:hypothetical protein